MLNIPPQNLRTPGPTPIPDDIFHAMSTQMINHRGPEFDALIKKATEQLKQVFMTKNDVLSSGACCKGSVSAKCSYRLCRGFTCTCPVRA